MIKEKTKEYLIMMFIPLAITSFLATLEIYGKEFLLPIGIGALGILILVSLIFYVIGFLQDRERRWKHNKKEHIEGLKSIEGIKREIEFIKSLYETNTKINKLEKDLSYLKGKFETRK